MNPYYSVWVDCLIRLKAQPANQKDWPIKAMIVMTAAMTFNWLLIIKVIEFSIIGHPFYQIDFYFLPATINTLLEFSILFIAPSFIINYLLIFRRKRYKELMEKYPYKHGRLFLGYFLGSTTLPIVLMWLTIFLNKSA